MLYLCTGDRQCNLLIYVGCAYRLVIHPQLVVIHQNGAIHSQSVFDVCMYRVVCVSVWASTCLDSAPVYTPSLWQSAHWLESIVYVWVMASRI